MTGTSTTAITPEGLEAVLTAVINESPAVLAEIAQFGPMCANLPAPFNLAAKPLVQQAAKMLPTWMPILQKVETALEQLNAPPQSNPPQSGEAPAASGQGGAPGESQAAQGQQ